jgi:hypothetical protein
MLKIPKVKQSWQSGSNDRGPEFKECSFSKHTTENITPIDTNLGQENLSLTTQHSYQIQFLDIMNP